MSTRAQRQRPLPFRMDTATAAEYLCISESTFKRLASLGSFGEPQTDCDRQARHAKKFYLTRNLEAYAERQQGIDPVARLHELEEAYRERARRDGKPRRSKRRPSLQMGD